MTPVASRRCAGSASSAQTRPPIGSSLPGLQLCHANPSGPPPARHRAAIFRPSCRRPRPRGLERRLPERRGDRAEHDEVCELRLALAACRRDTFDVPAASSGARRALRSTSPPRQSVGYVDLADERGSSTTTRSGSSRRRGGESASRRARERAERCAAALGTVFGKRLDALTRAHERKCEHLRAVFAPWPARACQRIS